MKWTLARADDWEGLYIDGKLKCEGHSLTSEYLIRLAIEEKPSELEVRWVDWDWIDTVGSLPYEIGVVKWEHP